jgi:formate hydrogenlyase subunit 4
MTVDSLIKTLGQGCAGKLYEVHGFFGKMVFFVCRTGSLPFEESRVSGEKEGTMTGNSTRPAALVTAVSALSLVVALAVLALVFPYSLRVARVNI